MSSDHCSQLDLFDRIHNFVVAAASNEATKEQWIDFEGLLRESDEACRLYFEYIEESDFLQTLLDAESDEESGSSGVLFPEQQEPIHRFAPGFIGNVWHGAIGFFSQEVPFAILIASVATGLALWIGSLISVSRDVEIARQSVPPVVEPSAPEKIEYVGRITGMVDCKWEKKGLGIGDWGLEKGSVFRGTTNLPSPSGRGAGGEGGQSLIPNPQSLVFLGDRFTLATGLMEITYDTGAKVILQGPATYDVESPAGGYLSLGKLTARLESREERSGERGEGVANHKSEIINHKSSLSTTHYPLFTIKTPTATVTDLGTEFGVEVSQEGQTTSHVFRGSVEVHAVAADGKAEGNAQVLHENQSAHVENRGKQGGNRVTVLTTAAKPTAFVRELPKRVIKVLDLVDVVAGGDGFSGKRNRGIDPANGQTRDSLANPARTEKEYVVGDRKYHRVDSLPMVDGVLIPDGSVGPMQVDSAGHVFDGFPTTSNQTYGWLWAGGVLTVSPPNIPTVLDSVDYASPGHGVLYLPSNQAITFNLDAVRRANSNYKVTRFRAVAGNTETAPATDKAVWADFWVLVDGQMRFRRREINAFSGAFPIAVNLSDNDHFLTLASTDGGNGIDWDWVLFGDPRLELVTVNVGYEINQQPNSNVERR